MDKLQIRFMLIVIEYLIRMSSRLIAYQDLIYFPRDKADELERDLRKEL